MLLISKIGATQCSDLGETILRQYSNALHLLYVVLHSLVLIAKDCSYIL